MALTIKQAIATQVSLAYLGRPQDVGALTTFGFGLTADAIPSPTATQLAALFATTESKAVFGATATMSSVVAKSFELVGRVATSQNITDILTWANDSKLDISQLPWEIIKIAMATEQLLPQASQVVWARLSVAYQLAEDISGNATALQSLATSTTQQDAARAVISGVTSFATIATAYPATGSGTAANFVSGVASSSGQTFTLTTDIDNFNGTSGNDTVTGTTATLSVADSLTGGAGVDTLRIFDLGTGDVVLPAAFSGFENLYVNTLGNSLNVSSSGVTAVELDALAAAVTLTVTTGQAITLDSTNAGGTTTIAGNTPTSLTVTVDGIDSAITIGAINEDLEFSGTALATLNIIASNAASVFEIGNNGLALRTLNISGNQNLTMNLDDLADALVTTVNATGYTGNMTLVLDDDTARDVAVTGGSGNDRVDFGALLTQADKFDGGGGIDSLEITQASATTVAGLSAANLATFRANFINLEVLRISDAVTASLNATHYNAINSYVFESGISTAGTVTLSNVASGVTVELNAPAAGADDILAVDILNATLAGNNSDTLNLVLNDTVDGGDAAVTHHGVLNAVGVDILNINSTRGNDILGDASTATGNELDIANTTTALKTLTVTGNLGLDIGDVSLVNTIQTINASGLVLSAVTAAGLEVVVAGAGGVGVTITGSNGVDNIIAGAGSDVIDGGAGADIIDGGAGNNVITGGAGADDFVMAALAATGTNNQKTIITDFVVGTDDIDVNFVLVDDAGENAAVTDFLDVSAGATTTTLTANRTTAIFEFSNANDFLGAGVEGNFNALTATGAELEEAVLKQILTDVAIAQTASVDKQHMIFVMYDESNNAVLVSFTDATDAADIFSVDDFYEFIVLQGVAAGSITAGDFV